MVFITSIALYTQVPARHLLCLPTYSAFDLAWMYICNAEEITLSSALRTPAADEPKVLLPHPSTA